MCTIVNMWYERGSSVRHWESRNWRPGRSEFFMERHEEIERLLIAEVDQARTAYDIARRHLDPAAQTTPRGMPGSQHCMSSAPSSCTETFQIDSRMPVKLNLTPKLHLEFKPSKPLVNSRIAGHPLSSRSRIPQQECASSSLQTAYSNLTTPS